MAITAKKLAEILGVSPSTVSQVFHGYAGISEKTRKRVLDAAAQYGYQHKLQAEPAETASRAIAYVVYRSEGAGVSDAAFFSAVLQGAGAEAQRWGFNLSVHYFGETQKLEEQLETVRASGAAAVILLATEMNRQQIGGFSTLGIPVVVLDHPLLSSNMDQIYTNNIQGAYAAVSYLLENGHQKIGYLSANRRIRNFAERQQGYCLAMQKLLGTAPDPRYHLEVGTTSDAAYADMRALLRKEIPLPTAFFADNDLIAAGCMRALREFGIRVPEDVSIIGFDDMPLCQFTEPRLSTIRARKSLLGVLAVRQAAERIQDEKTASLSVAVATNLVVRESVAPCEDAT